MTSPSIVPREGSGIDANTHIEGRRLRSSSSRSLADAAAGLADHTSPTVHRHDSIAELKERGKNLSSSHILSKGDWKTLGYLTIVAFAVRCFILDHPSIVVFDEVHFGGFAAKYLNHQFFMDVHPPLARMLITLVSYLAGFRGGFDFYDIGADYLANSVPYVAMRAGSAILGALLVPMAYVTAKAMHLKKTTATVLALAVLFDNALMTQSRLILLDSYLVFFTGLATMSWMLFQSESGRPFEKKWWRYLAATGTGLGLVASSKWVGLFTVASVGLYTVVDLWNLLGNTSIPLRTIGRHLYARATCLLVLPLAIYALTFAAHFTMLSEMGSGGSSMGIEFQQTLRGGVYPGTFDAVFMGSTVQLRQVRQDGAFLHSHVDLYPAGSKQQQITIYSHRDRNNEWIIRRPYVVNKTYTEDDVEADEQETLLWLRHGDLIRLEHVITHRFLHSHPVAPPISDVQHQFEMSGYGYAPQNGSDTNDNWRIELVDARGEPLKFGAKEVQRPQINAIRDRFRLVHANLGCTVHSRNRPLPAWGFRQGEVTCGRDTLKSNSIWTIETNTHPRIKESDAKNITYSKAGFWQKLKELNQKMWVVNAALTADHPFASRPGSWPLMERGLGFWNGNHIPKIEKAWRREREGLNIFGSKPPELTEEEKKAEEEEQAQKANDYAKFKYQQIYLLGNPAVWWPAALGLALYLTSVLLVRIGERRSISMLATFGEEKFRLATVYGFPLVAWALHYFPFFLMARQLFIHHYLPALYFSMLSSAVFYETAISKLTTLRFQSHPVFPARIRSVALSAVIIAIILTYAYFAPLGYGMRLTRGWCDRMKWRAKWDFDCQSIPGAAASLAKTTSESLIEAAIEAAAEVEDAGEL